MGHIAISPLATVRDLPNQWLSPVASTPPIGRRPRLIINFTWSGLNEATSWEAPEKVMHFGGTLRHITRRLLLADPRLGPVYLGKVDLTNISMRLWVHLEYTPSVEFLVPRNKPTDEQ